MHDEVFHRVNSPHRAPKRKDLVAGGQPWGQPRPNLCLLAQVKRVGAVNRRRLHFDVSVNKAPEYSHFGRSVLCTLAVSSLAPALTEHHLSPICVPQRTRLFLRTKRHEPSVT
jgi:hypothetical protein